MIKKSELEQIVRTRAGLSIGDVKRVLNAVHDVVVETVLTGDNVMISGFGQYYPQEIKARELPRNFGAQNGVKRIVPAHRRLAFRPSKTIRGRLTESKKR